MKGKRKESKVELKSMVPTGEVTHTKGRTVQSIKKKSHTDGKEYMSGNQSRGGGQNDR